MSMKQSFGLSRAPVLPDWSHHPVRQTPFAGALNTKQIYKHKTNY